MNPNIWIDLLACFMLAFVGFIFGRASAPLFEDHLIWWVTGGIMLLSLLVSLLARNPVHSVIFGSFLAGTILGNRTAHLNLLDVLLFFYTPDDGDEEWEDE